MGLLSFLESVSGMRAGSNIEDPTSTLSAPAAWLLDAFGTRPSAAGVNVSPKTALLYGPALACQRVLAETVATVKVALVQKTGERTVRRDTNHVVHELVTRKFNEDLLAFNGYMNMQGHLCGWGNTFAEISFGRDGYPDGLLPLLPDRTFAERVSGKKVIRSTIGQDRVTLPINRVLHIPGWGYDGLSGYSPIRLATQAIGLGLAAEEFSSRWYSGGSRPSGVLTSDKAINPERAKLIKARWEDLHQGLSNSHRVAVLEDGLKFQAITVSPGDAQLLQVRQWQIPEICRAYRMAPHMIQHVEAGGAKANMEQQGLEFVMFTMMTWFRLWELSLTDALLSREEIRNGYEVMFLVGSLLRGDFKTQAEAIALLRQWGVYSANDARARIDENAIENGDVYLVPMNMISAELAATWKPEAPKPTEPKPAAPNPSPTAPPRKALANGASVELRERYRKRLASVVAAGARQYVRHEVNHARRALRDLPDQSAFWAKMEELWTGETFAAMVRRDLGPGLMVLAEYLGESAITGGPDIDHEEAEDPEASRAMASKAAADGRLAAEEAARAVAAPLLAGASIRHAERSRDEISSALEEGNPGEKLAALFASWEETRAAEIAETETAMLAESVALADYRRGGSRL